MHANAVAQCRCAFSLKHLAKIFRFLTWEDECVDSRKVHHANFKAHTVTRY